MPTSAWEARGKTGRKAQGCLPTIRLPKVQGRARLSRIPVRSSACREAYFNTSFLWRYAFL
jgi:hypothetical protein